MSSFWEENHLSTVLARVALQDLRYFRGQHLPLALKYFELQHNLGPISTSETNTLAPGLCHPASESGPSLWPGEMMLTVKYFLLRKVTWTLSPTAPNVISDVKKTLSAENLRRRSVRQCQVKWSQGSTMLILVTVSSRTLPQMLSYVWPTAPLGIL